MAKGNPSRASASLRVDMQRNIGRRRASRRSPARVWVRAHESGGHLVRGHWRDNSASGGTVLEEDWRNHVQQLLSAHANAVQFADQVRAQLAAYARGLTG